MPLISFKKIPAALFNRSVVERLPGDAIRLQASHNEMAWRGHIDPKERCKGDAGLEQDTRHLRMVLLGLLKD